MKEKNCKIIYFKYINQINIKIFEYIFHLRNENFQFLIQIE